MNVKISPLLMRVLSWDERGRPKNVELVYDDTVVKLRQGDEFVTVQRAMMPGDEDNLAAPPEKATH